MSDKVGKIEFGPLTEGDGLTSKTFVPMPGPSSVATDARTAALAEGRQRGLAEAVAIVEGCFRSDPEMEAAISAILGELRKAQA